MSAVGRHVRALDVLGARLFAPLLSARTAPGGWRVVSWDVEQGLCLTLARGDDVVVLIELEARDEARPCYARTARFNVCARRVFETAELGDPERRAVDAVVRLVRAREAAALPVVPRPATSGRTAVREIEVDRVLMAEGAGHYYVNPYVGCVIGCDFCYVAARADLSRALEGLPELPFGRWLDVKANAPEVLRREVRGVPPGIVRMSPILTDPYQPIERRHGLTRACLEVLLEAGFSPVVLTRAALVRRDADLLRRFPRAAVGLSIPTDDDRVRRLFEPGADPIDERLEALRACHEAGIRTFCVVQPMLPMDPRRLVDLVAPHVRAVRIDRMHDVPRVLHLYEAAGIIEASTDAFFERTGAELRRLFAERAIPLDELDALAPLLSGQ